MKLNDLYIYFTVAMRSTVITLPPALHKLQIETSVIKFTVLVVFRSKTKAKQHCLTLSGDALECSLESNRKNS